MKPTKRYIIRPGTNYSPNSAVFLEMDKKKLKEFYQWFMLSLPYCIEELMQLIANTPGFESWEADDSPKSLDVLGAWFATKVEKRDFTSEEIEAIKSKQTKLVEFTSWDLTDETKSLALYVGMYYGEVVLRNNPLVKWEQLLSARKFADYGQPILNGVGVVPINPVRVAHSVAREFITDGKKGGGELRKAYDYWSKLVMPATRK
jgi:hypothetical protein